MNMQLLKDGLIWGVVLWFIGYILGFIFFAFVPATLIGWCITPLGTIITLFILLKYIKGNSLSYYALLGCMWMLVALVFDYFFLVLLLHPADGYYKPDVYLYYGLTLLLLPLAFLIWKRKVI